ncbi:MAG TPA: hypothetical protein DCX07_08925 [Phycisphaerales bacterium]|nr:hypothetical protein [Phycisphaerales bacterium]
MKTLQVETVTLNVLDRPRLRRREDLLELYWRSHPRWLFLKSAPPGAKVLDVGAGSGGMVTWKGWCEPRREDLRMYAVDRVRGEMFDRYDGWQVADLDVEPVRCGEGAFDAVVMSHVLEHLSDEDAFFARLEPRLAPGAQVYIELPAPWTAVCPSRTLFLERGIDVSTVNFFDDATHKRTFDRPELWALLERHGFRILHGGAIRNRFLEDELFTFGYTHRDQELTTYGVWSKLSWAQYLVVERP